MVHSETQPTHHSDPDKTRLEMVLKNTFSALDQLTDLFTEIRKG
jgi:hypothetical protein